MHYTLSTLIIALYNISWRYVFVEKFLCCEIFLFGLHMGCCTDWFLILQLKVSIPLGEMWFNQLSVCSPTNWEPPCNRLRWSIEYLREVMQCCHCLLVREIMQQKDHIYNSKVKDTSSNLTPFASAEEQQLVQLNKGRFQNENVKIKFVNNCTTSVLKYYICNNLHAIYFIETRYTKTGIPNSLPVN